MTPEIDAGDRATLPAAPGAPSKALPRRWLLLGAGGAGKSTLAARLGEVLRLPVVHLDRHFWKPGWVAPSDAEWDARVEELVRQEEWIMDGNYSRTLHLRLTRAQAVVLLDPPTAVCLWGVLGRGLLRRGKGRKDLPDGCEEHLPSLEFLHYVATYKRRSRPKVLGRIAEAPHVRLFHLRSRGQARELVGMLRQGWAG